MTFAELWRAVAGDLRRSFAALVAFEAIFKALVALLFLPTLALLLLVLVRWSGHTALTNEDLLTFALSPPGVLYAFVLGLKALGVTLLDHAGVTAIAALKQTGHWHGFRHAMTALAFRTLGVLRLTALLVGIAAGVVAPFAGLAALTYYLLLGGQDINYYLADRPPRFYLAAGIGAALLAGAVTIVAVLYVRWSFALCIVLLEQRGATAALAASAERTRGARWRIGAVLLGWQAVGVLLQLATAGAFRLIAGVALSGAGHSPRAVVPVVLTLLVLHSLVAAVVSAVVVFVHCLLLFRLYAHRSIRVGALDPEHWADSLERQPAKPGRALARLEWGVALVGIAAAAATLALAVTLDLGDRPEVTAHRGASRVAPENSLAAVQKAIDLGADWAEIDVQLTRDGEIVLLHDADLKRMSGDPRSLRDLPLLEVRRLKFLPRFGEEFADERLPTLQEVIELARGRIRLNIELKFYGRDYTLARKVADLIAENEFENECFVASLTYEGVQEAKRHRPGVRTAAIVTVGAGDISRLDVDILSVKLSLATDELLRKARRLNKQVHVWTVNDSRTMRRLLDRGVKNVITDEPGLLVELRREHAERPDAQRLILACRHLLE